MQEQFLCSDRTAAGMTDTLLETTAIINQKYLLPCKRRRSSCMDMVPPPPPLLQNMHLRHCVRHWFSRPVIKELSGGTKLNCLLLCIVFKQPTRIIYTIQKQRSALLLCLTNSVQIQYFIVSKQSAL